MKPNKMIVPMMHSAMVMCHGSPGSMDPVLPVFAVTGSAMMAMINRLPMCKALFPCSVINPRL